LELQAFGARAANEIERVISNAAKTGVDTLAVTDDVLFSTNYRNIAELGINNRLRVIGSLGLAWSGGLIGYGPNPLELFYRGAYFVDRILKGTKPADLPVEQPTRFVLAVNLKTAMALGINVPPTLLALATEVIE
jgi:putative ABC transport system substrate-binding protein